MADFCNVCADRLFGNEVKPEIDVYQISEHLEPGKYVPVLCEGCGMIAIERGTDDELYLITQETHKYQSWSIKDWQEGELYKKYE